MSNKKKGILHDHERKGKRFVPPILNALGEKHSPYSWAHQLVPQVLWISLLIDKYGIKLGKDIAVRFAGEAFSACSKNPKAMFVTATSFLQLTCDEMDRTIGSVAPTVLGDLSMALSPIGLMCGDHPLGCVTVSPAVESDADQRQRLERVLDELYDRTSRLSALTMATAEFLGISQEKIKYPIEMLPTLKQHSNSILDYPETEESRIAASRFRAGVPVMLLPHDDEDKELDGKWVAHFWTRVSGFGECIWAEPVVISDEVPDDDMGSIIFKFRNAAKNDLRVRAEWWKIDLNATLFHEVVLSMLARQVSIAIEFAVAPAMWTPNSAPILLRSMADLFISFAWIFSHREDGPKRFVEDGLGAVKLEIEHRKEHLKLVADSQDRELQSKMIEMREAWLKSQRLYHLIEVNLGSWSGLSTRKMAEESGFIDFYNYVYQPFSAAVDSTWAHIGAFNVFPCSNPAHRGHRLPIVTELEPDWHWLYLAAKYLQKTLDHFDEQLGFASDEESAFDVLSRHLSTLGSDSANGGSPPSPT